MRSSVDLTKEHSSAAGAGANTLFRGLIALVGGGGENLPNAQSGTENVGQPITRGCEWIATTDTALVDAQEGTKPVAVDNLIICKKAPPTTVDDFAVIAARGPAGESGDAGKSAFELAAENGFSGSVAAWLLSLKGEPGDAGETGRSAYELAVLDGFSGSTTEWLASLAGQNGTDGDDGSNGTNGQSAYELAAVNGFSGSVTEWLASLAGQDGQNGTDGTDGTDGIDGQSAYQLAVANGFSGTVSDWLESLKGQDGNDGAGQALSRDDYAAEDATLDDELLFADDSDSNAIKRTTFDKIREVLGVVNNGIYRGTYTPPLVDGSPDLPYKHNGSIVELRTVPQSRGDLYVCDRDGEIGIPGDVTPVYENDLLIIENAPPQGHEDVRIVHLGVWNQLVNATDGLPFDSDAILAIGANGQGKKISMTLLVSAIRAIDEHFSATELNLIRAALQPRNPTKIARFIFTTAVNAGTTIQIDGGDSFATLLSGSEFLTLPATAKAFCLDNDIEVFVDGVLSNKVLDNNTHQISNPIAYQTVVWKSTTTIQFARDIPVDSIVEIKYHNAPGGSVGGDPPPPPPAAITAPMGNAATIELAGYYNGSTYSVVSVTGDGTAEIRGTQLIYQSGIESGTQTVNYRATQGAVVNDASLQIALTDTDYTLAEAEAFVLHDIKNLVAEADNFAGNQTLCYNASYTALALRNLFQGTGNLTYFTEFKDLITRAIASATVTVTTVTTGNPPQGGVPHEDYGASGDYDTWGTTPNQKATDQFSMTALLFLFDIIDERGQAAQSAGVLSAADKTWATDTAYPFFQQLLEHNRCLSGDSGYTMVYVADSARRRVPNHASSLRWGYWTSNVGVAMAAGLVENAIRDSLSLPANAYWQTQQTLSLASNANNPVGDARDWYDWWKESVEFDDEGRATWDVENPNLQTSNGWGFPGETKAPDIGHGFGRYAYIVWFMEYAGRDTEAAAINLGFDKQFDELIVLPNDYVTPDGDHEGEIAEGIQLSNYITGDDGPFRNFKNAANSTAGMGSMIYYSQRGFKRPEGREALARLYALGTTYIGPTSKEHTGTYSRHAGHTDYNDPAANSKSYAGMGLLGNLLAATAQPM